MYLRQCLPLVATLYHLFDHYFFAHTFAQLYDQTNATNNLVINVKNFGGEVYQELISANTTDDLIIIEFRETDGSIITQLIDFKSEVQVYRIIRLGEQELDESEYQVMCFVTHLPRNELISSDAMSKLRQRNPNAIRQPEEDKGKEFYEMDLSVELGKSSIISPHLPKLCSDATNATFAREIDLRFWTNSKAMNRDIISLTSSVHKLPVEKPVRCIACESDWASCQCHVQMCTAWYPCALKFCKGKDTQSGKTISYRCGIKTCRKCRDFYYYVKHKLHCLWDT